MENIRKRTGYLKSVRKIDEAVYGHKKAKTQLEEFLRNGLMVKQKEQF